jgi:hypothetical protein
MFGRHNSFTTRLVAIVLLFFFSGTVFGQSIQTMLPEGVNESAFDRYLDHADQAQSREDWRRLAEFGIEMVTAEWEREVFLADGFAGTETPAEVRIELEEAAEARFTQWVTESYFDENITGDVTILQSVVDSANMAFLFDLDENGEIQYHEGTTDPMLKGLEGADTDRESYAAMLQDAVDAALTAFTSDAEARYGELLALVDDPATLQEAFDAQLLSAEEAYRNELEKLSIMEERRFYARRTMDQYSLRAKSEAESARMQAEKLIEQAEDDLNEGIALLQQGLANPVDGAGNPLNAIDAEQWREDFNRVFDAGMRRWEEAEEDLLYERMNWDQEASAAFAEGEKAWQDAYELLTTAKAEWHEKLTGIINKAKDDFGRAETALLDTIAEAEIRMTEQMSIRKESVTGQIQGLVDMYLESARMVQMARGNLSYLEERDNSPQSSIDFWTDMETTYLNYLSSAEDRLIRSYGIILRDNPGDESSVLSFESYGGGYGIDTLLNDFELVTWESGTDPESESPWDSLLLDDYEVQLVKARILKDYWDKQLDIAQAVYDYSTTLSSERETEGATQQAYDDAYQAFLTVEAEYTTAIEALTAVENSISDERDALVDAQEVLQELAGPMAELEEALREVQMRTLDISDEYYRSRLTQYYQSLLQTTGIVLGEDQVYDAAVEYFQAARDFGIETYYEALASEIGVLYHGNTDIQSYAELKALADFSTGFTVDHWFQEDGNLDAQWVDDLAALGAGDALDWYFTQISQESLWYSDMRMGASDDELAAYQRIMQDRLQSIIVGVLEHNTIAFLERKAKILMLSAPDAASWIEAMESDLPEGFVLEGTLAQTFETSSQESLGRELELRVVQDQEVLSIALNFLESADFSLELSTWMNELPEGSSAENQAARLILHSFALADSETWESMRTAKIAEYQEWTERLDVFTDYFSSPEAVYDGDEFTDFLRSISLSDQILSQYMSGYSFVLSSYDPNELNLEKAGARYSLDLSQLARQAESLDIQTMNVLGSLYATLSDDVPAFAADKKRESYQTLNAMLEDYGLGTLSEQGELSLNTNFAELWINGASFETDLGAYLLTMTKDVREAAGSIDPHLSQELYGYIQKLSRYFLVSVVEMGRTFDSNLIPAEGENYSNLELSILDEMRRLQDIQRLISKNTNASSMKLFVKLLEEQEEGEYLNLSVSAEGLLPVDQNLIESLLIDELASDFLTKQFANGLENDLLLAEIHPMLEAHVAEFSYEIPATIIAEAAVLIDAHLRTALVANGTIAFEDLTDAERQFILKDMYSDELLHIAAEGIGVDTNLLDALYAISTDLEATWPEAGFTDQHAYIASQLDGVEESFLSEMLRFDDIVQAEAEDSFDVLALSTAWMNEFLPDAESAQMFHFMNSLELGIRSLLGGATWADAEAAVRTYVENEINSFSVSTTMRLDLRAQAELLFAVYAAEAGPFSVADLDAIQESEIQGILDFSPLENHPFQELLLRTFSEWYLRSASLWDGSESIDAFENRALNYASAPGAFRQYFDDLEAASDTRMVLGQYIDSLIELDRIPDPSEFSEYSEAQAYAHELILLRDIREAKANGEIDEEFNASAFVDAYLDNEVYRQASSFESVFAVVGNQNREGMNEGITSLLGMAVLSLGMLGTALKREEEYGGNYLSTLTAYGLADTLAEDHSQAQALLMAQWFSERVGAEVDTSSYLPLSTGTPEELMFAAAEDDQDYFNVAKILLQNAPGYDLSAVFASVDDSTELEHYQDMVLAARSYLPSVDSDPYSFVLEDAEDSLDLIETLAYVQGAKNPFKEALYLETGNETYSFAVQLDQYNEQRSKLFATYFMKLLNAAAAENQEALIAAAEERAIQQAAYDIRERYENEEANWRSYISTLFHEEIPEPQQAEIVTELPSDASALDDLSYTAYHENDLAPEDPSSIQAGGFFENELLDIASDLAKTATILTEGFSLFEQTDEAATSERFFGDYWDNLTDGTFDITESPAAWETTESLDAYQTAAMARQNLNSQINFLKTAIAENGQAIIAYLHGNEELYQELADAEDALAAARTEYNIQLNTVQTLAEEFRTAQTGYNTAFTTLEEIETRYNTLKHDLNKAEAIYRYASSAYLGDDFGDNTELVGEDVLSDPEADAEEEEEKAKIPVDPESRLEYTALKRAQAHAVYDALNQAIEGNASSDFAYEDELYRQHYEAYLKAKTEEIHLQKLSQLLGEEISKQKQVIHEAEVKKEKFLNKKIVKTTGFSLESFSVENGMNVSYKNYLTLTFPTAGSEAATFNYRPTLLGRRSGNQWIYLETVDGEVQFIDTDIADNYFYFGGSVYQLVEEHGFTQENAEAAYEAYSERAGEVNGEVRTYALDREAEAANLAAQLGSLSKSALHELMTNIAYAIQHQRVLDSSGRVQGYSDEQWSNLTTDPTAADQVAIGTENFWRGERAYENTYAYYDEVAKTKKDIKWHYDEAKFERDYDNRRSSAYTNITGNATYNRIFQYLLQADQVGTMQDQTSRTGANDSLEALIEDEIFQTLLDDSNKDEAYFINKRNDFLKIAAVNYALAVALAWTPGGWILPLSIAGAATATAGVFGLLELSEIGFQKHLTNTERAGQDAKHQNELIGYQTVLHQHTLNAETVRTEEATLAAMQGGDAITNASVLTALEESFAKKGITIEEFLNLSDEEIDGQSALDYIQSLLDNYTVEEEDATDIYSYLSAMTSQAKESAGDAYLDLQDDVDRLRADQIELAQLTQQAQANLALFYEQASYDPETGTYLAAEDWDGPTEAELLSTLQDAAAEQHRAASFVNRTHQMRMTETSMMFTNKIGVADDLSMQLASAELEKLGTQLSNFYGQKLNNYMDLKRSEWNQMRVDFQERKDEFNLIIWAITARGETEWQKAYRKLSARRQAWLDTFNEEYELKSAQWDLKYANFQAAKSEWIKDVATQAALASSSTLGYVSTSVEESIAESTTEVVGSMLDNAPNATEIVAELTGGTLATLLENAEFAALSLGRIDTNLHSGIKSDSFTDTDMMAILKAHQNEDREELEKEILLITAMQAIDSILEAQEGLEDQLTSANEGMESSMDAMFASAGWEKSGEGSTAKYTRDVIEDSTLIDGDRYYERTIEGYDFYTVNEVNIDPGFALEIDSFMDKSAESIESMIDRGLNAVELATEAVFGSGETYEKTVLGRERKEVKEIRSAFKEDSDGEMQPYEYEVMVTKFLPKEYTIEDLQDGLFNEHVGYSPALVDAPDMEKIWNADDMKLNFQYDGEGEMGEIMRAFYMYTMRENRGISESMKPVYERRIWDDDNSFIAAPSLRSVVDIGVTVAATLLTAPMGGIGGALIGAGLGLTDDLVFAALDIGVDGQDFGEVAFGFGQKALVSVGSSMIGGAMGGFGEGLGTSTESFFNKGFSEVFGETMFGQGMQSLTTAVAQNTFSGLANSVTYSAGGNWGFDSNTFKQSLYGQNALAGYMGSFAEGAFGDSIKSSFAGDYKKGTRMYQMTQSAAKLTTQMLGKGTEYLSHVGMNGIRNGGINANTFSQSFDDMGGLTFNLLDAGALLDTIVTGAAFLDNDFDGADYKGLMEASNSLSGTGLFEMHIGTSGIDFQFGTGGMNLGQALYDSTKLSVVESAMKKYREDEGVDESTIVNLGYQLGDDVSELNALRLLFGRDKLELTKFDDKNEEGETILQKGHTTVDENGSRTIRINKDMNLSQQTVALAHEAYRDGTEWDGIGEDTETNAAVTGHIHMANALISHVGYGWLDQNIYEDLKKYNEGIASGNMDAFNDYVASAYDGTEDNWKLVVRADGTHYFEEDGNKYLSIEYLNEDGEVIGYQKVNGQEVYNQVIPENQDYQNSVGYAASLGNLLDDEMAANILGFDVNNISNYDDDTLMYALDMNEEELRLFKREIEHFADGDLGIVSLSKTQRNTLIGQTILLDVGAVWNDETGRWEKDGESGFVLDGVRLTDRNLENQGRILAEFKGGNVHYSTVRATVYRDVDSYKGWSFHEGDKYDPVNQGLDSIMIEKYDLDGYLWEYAVFTDFHTVDNMIHDKDGIPVYDQTTWDREFGVIQGNTIQANQKFGLTYYSSSGYSGEIDNVTNAVLTINNAVTVDGTQINNLGNPDRRWLLHSNRWSWAFVDFGGGYYSDGCFVAPYEIIQSFYNALDSFGISQGYQIDTWIYEGNY